MLPLDEPTTDCETLRPVILTSVMTGMQRLQPFAALSLKAALWHNTDACAKSGTTFGQIAYSGPRNTSNAVLQGFAQPSIYLLTRQQARHETLASSMFGRPRTQAHTRSASQSH